MREKKRSFVSLWSESGSWIGHGGRAGETQDGIAAADTVTAIAAAVFFLDATKKYGRIITSFAVVPFALARVARVVKSADVNSRPPPPLPPVRPTVFLPRRCGRSCQIFIAPTSLSRGAGSRNRLALYGIGTTRKERKTGFTSGSHRRSIPPLDINRLRRITMRIV